MSSHTSPSHMAVSQSYGPLSFYLTLSVFTFFHVMCSLYKLFLERDATLVEVNPISETHDGRSQLRISLVRTHSMDWSGGELALILILLHGLFYFHFPVSFLFISLMCGC